MTKDELKNKIEIQIKNAELLASDSIDNPYCQERYSARIFAYQNVLEWLEELE